MEGSHDSEPVGYELAGLRIASEIPLTGLRRREHGPERREIRIWRRGPGPAQGRWVLESEQRFGAVRQQLWRGDPAAEGFRLRYEQFDDFAEFRLSPDGRDIMVHSAGDVTRAGMIALLEGIVLGSALRLAGSACLHANVLVADGRAIALLGPSGAGKSSLSWSLLEQGCRLMSDDLAGIETIDGVAVAAPGRTSIRMWPETADRLGVVSSPLGQVYPEVDGAEKLVFAEPGACAEAPAPLCAIYFLRPRETGRRHAAVAEMGGAEALAALASNVYGVFQPEIATRRREVAALAALVQAVPVRSLTLPDDLGLLPEVARTLRATLFR